MSVFSTSLVLADPVIFTGFKLRAPIPETSKASYLVFPWGTNDPVEAASRKAESHGEPCMYAGGYYDLSPDTFSQLEKSTPCIMVERS